MIPTLALIVAIYAIVRLLQVPIEASAMEKRAVILWILSIPAALAIGLLALDLIMTAAQSNSALGNLVR